MRREWCPVCCTTHEGVTTCPGHLNPSSLERAGWRITVETERGLEAYGVLVAQSDELWRARVITFPNILWKAPGVPGTLKFVGRTDREAMDSAIDFVRRHCVERGHTMRGDRFLDPPQGGTGPAGALVPAQRKIRFLPLRFGVVQPTEAGGTGNLSETGLYIITSAPLDPGDGLTMSLRVQEQQPLELSGRVIWMTRLPRVGAPPGMGIRLAAPPPSYRNYVRQLS